MKYSNEVVEQIKTFEGLRLTAYRCPAGVWTIGYGTTGKVDGKAIGAGMKITKEKATMLLMADMDRFEQLMAKTVPSTLSQCQWDAVLSFAYNCGIGNLKKSTLLKKIKKNASDPTIRTEFMKWTRGGGKVLPGLVRRRTWEGKRYFGEV